MKDPATTAESNTAPAATASLGLNGTDTKFLEHYARERDLAKAAKAAGTTPELVMARRVGHPGFGEAMSALEQQLEIPKYTQIGAGFEWDDTKRSSFIEHYINSGEIDSARQAVGCTRSQYFAEIKRNTQFANDVEAARPFAESVVEEAFIRAAKQGQQSILPKYMEIIEKRDAQRLDTPSDPTKARAELQKMLGEVQARFNKERAWRIISTGVVVPRPQLEKIFLFRDRKTGATYKPEEVEDVTALLWNQQQNNAAALAAAPDMAAASPDAAPEYYNTASDARDDDLLTGEDLT
jgi:hypothetical protein